MAKKLTNAGVPDKTTRGSRKKTAPTHETHGALEPKKEMNMIKAFGIRDGYDVETVEEYMAKINEMTLTDLHDHAHMVGVVPLDPREKLLSTLERKFVQSKMDQKPPKVIQVKTNPNMAEFMKKWWAGEATNSR